MAISKELQRLRTAERELANWYKQYLKPDRQQSTDELKAMRRGYAMSGHHDMVAMVNRTLTQRAADGVARLETLQAEVQSAAAAVKARAVRTRPPATEAAKSDIRAILFSPYATPGSAAQWILSAKKGPEYWSAFEEVTGQMIAAAGPIGESARHAREMSKQVADAIAGYEPASYTAQEQELAREAQEVDACMGLLQLGLKDASEYVKQESKGIDGYLPKFGIKRWPGLPDPQHPNGLLQPGKSSIPLMDEKGNFIVADELQEV